MAQLRWTPQAAGDLEAIAAYIAADSVQYAQIFVSDLLKAVEQLAVFPRSGRIVPEVSNPAIREIFLGSYRIIYRVKSDIVEILTICHGARLFDPSIFSLGTGSRA